MEPSKLQGNGRKTGNNCIFTATAHLQIALIISHGIVPCHLNISGVVHGCNVPLSLISGSDPMCRYGQPPDMWFFWATNTHPPPSMVKNALVINANTPLGLQVVRKVSFFGYDVLALGVHDDDDDRYFDNSLELAQYSNPELKGKFTLELVDPAILSNQEEILKTTSILSKTPFNLIISLNPTEDNFIKWDLNLIYALLKMELINTADTTVIVGRNSTLTTDTYNKALEKNVTNLGKALAETGIDFADLIQLGSVPGDEEYIADTYATELLRKQFKVLKVTSVGDLINYIIFYYFPSFLLSTVVYLESFFITNDTAKEKKE